MKLNVDQELRKAKSAAAAGQIDAASAIYQAILAKFPSNKRARDGLSELAGSSTAQLPEDQRQALLALYRQGRLAEVAAQATGLIEAWPHSVFLHNLAGAAFTGIGRLEEAVASYDSAVAIKPDYVDAWTNRGVALQALGRLDEALASHDRALQLNPAYAEGHCNRGNSLQAMGRAAEAVESYGRAIRHRPDYADAWSNRGILLKEMGRFEEALADCDRAITLAPGSPNPYSNRGAVLLALGRLDEAIAAFETAIHLNPDHAEAHANRGVALRDGGRLDEAVLAYRRAIELRPGYAGAQYNLGNALQDMKRFDEATDAYAEAVALDPGQIEALNQLYYQRARMCRWPIVEPATDLARFGIDTGAVTPFVPLIVDTDAMRNRQRAERFTLERYGRGGTMPAFLARAPGAKLRIGYFSADFHDHATMYLMARLFEVHDRDAHEIHAFSFGPDRQDGMRARLIAAIDGFHDVRDLDDRAVAELARQQGIDVAVDLKGHTQHARSGIFLHRAAPVQINYLGFPGTMGADFIDYIVVDPVLAPEGSYDAYSEKLILLPDSYQVNDDRREIAEAVPSRAALGLPERGFVFCSFNNSYKITPAEFAIWMRLLDRVEGSVLWLLDDNIWATASLRAEAAKRGVDPDRLVFAPRAPLAGHLARHAHADLFLDTFTVNAHTTASDALWAGLPLLTKPGESLVARVAASLLAAIGLPDLIVETAEDYERLALELATDPPRLAALKEKLAAHRTSEPLFDTVRFARHIEHGYRLAHERHAAGLPPDHIVVPCA